MSTTHVTTRIATLVKNMEEHGFAGMAVNAGPSLTYLTGLHFHLMERPVVFVFTPASPVTIILPELERAKLTGLPFPASVYPYGEDPGGWENIFKEALEAIGLSGAKIGVEPRQLRLLEYKLLRGACQDVQFTDGSSLVAGPRSIKDDDELLLMRQAVMIAEDALEETLLKVKIGVSEKEIASELFLQLIGHGSETSLPFSPIVAAGPNGANPHAKPSGRKLQEGDLLVIDWGASFGGYASDLTRTFGVGKLDAESEKIHHLVQRANEAGRLAGKPGVTCDFVDSTTRNVIEQGGYGQHFTHRTGHGIGMECHEEPYIRNENNQQLQAGMTYTIEPGIYLPGKNGVRIEDDVVVTLTGAESLSTMSRKIRYVGA
ncbi:MAG: aminopeptidase P family protein [Desulfobulbaceae bacterium]|nr:aminopeptidase P family protein [Desulfobulbaceae bacterium]